MQMRLIIKESNLFVVKPQMGMLLYYRNAIWILYSLSIHTGTLRLCWSPRAISPIICVSWYVPL